jgi:hypothetical protein
MQHVEQALRDFICLFDELRLPYAVMGGLAVRAYGIPRPTYDVDVILAIDEDRLPELFTAVEVAGYTVPDSYRAGWIDRIAEMPLIKFRIYRPDNQSVDVDVFLMQTAYQREIMSRRRLAELGIGKTWVITAEDIILLKLVAGRSRDMGDIEDVRFMEGDLDYDYMRHWADRLGVRDKLEEELARPPL